MPDETDHAQALEEMERDRSIERARAPRPAGASLAECEAPRCGAPIPLARQLALQGVRLCVACASEQERYQRLFARA
jgi:phage/conjugal plasmid C-4 type zinc finger TraR family protein